MIMASAAFASIDVHHSCENTLCAVNDPVTFEFEIYNNLESDIVIYTVLALDNKNFTPLAREQISVLLPGKQTGWINLTKQVDLPDEGFTWYYNPCMLVAFAHTPNVTQKICGDAERQLTLTPESKLGCREDVQCEAGTYCNQRTYRCMELECADNEAVFTNECRELACGKNELAQNHTCVVKTNPVMDGLTKASNGVNSFLADNSQYGPYVIFGILAIVVLAIIGVLFHQISGEKVIIYKGSKKKVKRRKK